MIYPPTDKQKHIAEIYQEIFIERSYFTPRCDIRPGDVVLDAGAHIGTFTLYALIHSAEHVIAVEPNSNTFPYLLRNLAESGFPSSSYTPVCSALWSSVLGRGRRLRFLRGRSSIGSHVVGPTSSYNCYVNATTIDALSEAHGRIDFIKIDTEGCELQILHGAESTIRKYRPRLADCVYHHHTDHLLIPDFINSLGLDYHQEITDGMLLAGRYYPIGHWS